MEYNPDLEPKDEYPFYQVDFGTELTGQHGTLIRYEPLTGHAVPGKASTAYRVIYESTSGIGDQIDKPMPVSGIIAFPAESASEDPWPVLSWCPSWGRSPDRRKSTIR